MADPAPPQWIKALQSLIDHHQSLSQEGQKRLETIPTVDPKTSPMEPKLKVPSDGDLRQAFLKAYTQAPETFDKDIGPALLDKAFVHAVYNKDKVHHREDGNETCLQQRIAEYLWSESPLSVRNKLKALLQTDDEIINSIKLAFGQMVNHLPPYLLLDLSQWLASFYTDHKKQNIAHVEALRNLRGKLALYQERFKDLRSDPNLSELQDQGQQYSDRVIEHLKAQIADHETHVKTHNAYISLIERTFKPEPSVSICQICAHDPIDFALQCGHVICERCFNRLSVNENDGENEHGFYLKCPFCKRRSIGDTRLFL